jgi:hypothetical protein
MIGIEGVAGYAIGTVQILLLDWWRKISAHRRQLRLLRAELRRLATHSGKFDWVDGEPPDSNRIPNPPVPTEAFVRTIAETDFSITDAHRDDNLQQAMLSIAVGCEQCQRYVDRFTAMTESFPGADPEVKKTFLEVVPTLVEAYDAKVDQVTFAIDQMLADLESRFSRLTIVDQFARAFAGLPVGSNPAPVEVGDARITEWKARRAPRE